MFEVPQEVTQADFCRVPDQPCTRRRRVDAHLEHAAAQVQGLVREPAAGRAAQAFEQHAERACAARFAAREASDQFRMVVGGPAIRARRLAGARRRSVPVAVVVAETRPRDEFGDGPAAVAAHRFVAPGDPRVDREPARDGLAAMEAGGALRAHGDGVGASRSPLARAGSPPQRIVTPSRAQSSRTRLSGRDTARYSVRPPPRTAAAGGMIRSHGHNCRYHGRPGSTFMGEAYQSVGAMKRALPSARSSGRSVASRMNTRSVPPLWVPRGTRTRTGTLCTAPGPTHTVGPA